MPWSVADVDHFKAGLTEGEKRCWVNLANGVLRRCQKRQEEPAGGCEALAIRVANSRCEKGV